MPIPRLARVGTVAAAVIVLSSTALTSAAYGNGPHDHGRPSDTTFAVIGDIPYGAAEIASFPKVVAQINADPAVSLVAHLGDIKNGSSTCDDAYFSMIRSRFDQFQDPLVYTIGDNEWTDCHRPNNGAYNPLERLAAVRETFFDRPGFTLGKHPVRVKVADPTAYPENVRFSRDRISFAAVHIVGSNNSLAPWTGQTSPTPEQTAEVLGRTAAAIEDIHTTFATARRNNDRAVVLMTQADMFDPTVTNPKYADYFAFQPIVRAIAEESKKFDKPVYLFNGDSHVYNRDFPLASDSKWPAFYGLTSPVPNLSRITVDGSDNANDYLRVTITNNRRDPLTWVRVPFTTS
ncbi:MAG TPA: metallophosphoesterase [Propionibacteriaceae bacterium]